MHHVIVPRQVLLVRFWVHLCDHSSMLLMHSCCCSIDRKLVIFENLDKPEYHFVTSCSTYLCTVERLAVDRNVGAVSPHTHC